MPGGRGSSGESLYSCCVAPADSVKQPGILLLPTEGYSASETQLKCRGSHVGKAFLFSPDHKRFVVVTSRGIIESNTVESTLWMFSCDDVTNFLNSGASSTAPSPQAIAKGNATPEADYGGSYEPVISNVQWSADSKKATFLGETSPRTLPAGSRVKRIPIPPRPGNTSCGEN